MITRRINRFLLLALLGTVAACAPKPPPPPPPAPPPPPPVVVIPPIPTPPNYSAESFVTPPVGLDGRRITANTGIGELETLWHMRSALNVAALNCVQPEHQSLTDNYNLFLTNHKKVLNGANTAIEDMFRRENGSDYRRIRDTHSTQVYNFFSLPPVKEDFCRVAVQVAGEAALMPSDELTSYSYGGLRRMEDVFEAFFNEFDQYRRDLYSWYQNYAPERLPASTFAFGIQNENSYGSDSSVNTGYTGSNASTGPILTTTLPASTAAGQPANDPFTGYTPSTGSNGAMVQPLPGVTSPSPSMTPGQPVNGPFIGYTPSTAPSEDVVQPLPQPSIVPASGGEVVQPLPGMSSLPAPSAPAPSGAVVQPLPGVTPVPAPSGAMVQPLPGATPAPAPTPSGAVVQPLPDDPAPTPAPAQTPSGAVVQPLPGQTPAAAEPIMTQPASEDVWITANGDSVGTSEEASPAEEPQ